MRTIGPRLGALAVLATAACGQPAQPPAATPPVAPPAAPAAAVPAPAALTGFTRAAGVDVGGYFMPQTPVDVGGGYRLTNISVGPPFEFDKWDRGERIPTYAPVMIEFEDVTSPTKTNELGQDYHVVQARVLPSAYSVEAGRLRFAGADPKLGAVTFDGTIDPAALASARNHDGAEIVVIRGTLQVGSRRIDGLAFTFFLGD